jgi:hypothetical protein
MATKKKSEVAAGATVEMVYTRPGRFHDRLGTVGRCGDLTRFCAADVEARNAAAKQKKEAPEFVTAEEWEAILAEREKAEAAQHKRNTESKGKPVDEGEKKPEA